MTEKEALVIENSEVRYIRDAYIGERITVPDGITVIGADAFRVQGNLRVVVLPDGLTHIKERAFEHCFNLEMVYLPKSVEVIMDDAFKGCPKLKIYCEGEPKEGWIDREEKRHFVERYVTAEDDAFNFHRSGGSFTSTVHQYDKRVYCCYNPDKAEVVTNVTREQFEQLVKQIGIGK